MEKDPQTIAAEHLRLVRELVWVLKEYRVSDRLGSVVVSNAPLDDLLKGATELYDHLHEVTNGP